MKAIPRKGSWRKSAPGVYTKPVGAYGDLKCGATVRVSFVPFPTCSIIDANWAHAGVPTPADEKKFVAAAKKVYVKDTKAEAARLQKRVAARTNPPLTGPTPKAKPVYSSPDARHEGRHLAPKPPTGGGIHASIRALQSEADKFEYIASIPYSKRAVYTKRAAKVRARVAKLRE